LWKIQVAAMPQRLLESHDQAKKRGAKSRGLRVNHVDDVSRTLSRKSWQQKNFRGWRRLRKLGVAIGPLFANRAPPIRN
jgi:hypothetical protein